MTAINFPMFWLHTTNFHMLCVDFHTVKKNFPIFLLISHVLFISMGLNFQIFIIFSRYLLLISHFCFILVILCMISVILNCWDLCYGPGFNFSSECSICYWKEYILFCGVECSVNVILIWLVASIVNFLYFSSYPAYLVYWLLGKECWSSQQKNCGFSHFFLLTLFALCVLKLSY